MSTEREQLQKFMEQMRTFKKTFWADTQMAGSPYLGIEDFLLKHGQWMEFAPLDRTKYKLGAPKSCFGNALVLAVTRGLRYVEGMATMRGLAMPVHHAWNLDEQGRVVDTTWVTGRDDDSFSKHFNDYRAYIGVEFSPERAEDAIWFDACSVLDNFGNDYALYREEWKGEDFNKQWRRSRKIIQALKKAALITGRTK